MGPRFASREKRTCSVTDLEHVLSGPVLPTETPIPGAERASQMEDLVLQEQRIGRHSWGSSVQMRRMTPFDILPHSNLEDRWSRSCAHGAAKTVLGPAICSTRFNRGNADQNHPLGFAIKSTAAPRHRRHALHAVGSALQPRSDTQSLIAQRARTGSGIQVADFRSIAHHSGCMSVQCKDVPVPGDAF